jgi:hypothetical protein
MKDDNLEIKVFSFTVDEICRVIRGYPEGSSRYPSTIGVNTLYSNLKRIGWTKSDVREFISNIEKSLNKEGIKIEWGSKIDLDNYTPPDQSWENSIRQYKPDQGDFSRNHDLAAIEMIQAKRPHRVRRIEESRAFFLTSDNKLCRFNFDEMGHVNDSTICEVLQDRLVANILWLKNPNSGTPLKSIIAAHSRELLIDRRLWDKFNDVLRKLAKEGKVKDQDISILFYHGFIEDTLREMNESESDKITAEFVIEEIEKASKYRDTEIESITNEFREQENLFIEQLQKASEVINKEQQMAFEKISSIRKALFLSAEKIARRGSISFATLFTILALLATFGLYWLIENVLSWPGYSKIFIALFIGGGGLVGIWKNLRKHFETQFFDRIYLKKLIEASLDEEEKPPNPA